MQMEEPILEVFVYIVVTPFHKNVKEIYMYFKFIKLIIYYC